MIEYTPKPCFWTKFRKRLELLDEEDRWIRYAKHALELFNHDLMWQGIIEGCKILKYPELSEIHRDCIEALFDMLYFVWLQQNKFMPSPTATNYKCSVSPAFLTL